MHAIRASTALALLAFLLLAGAAEARLPRSFFGIAPQTPLTDADTTRMRRGGLDVVRIAVPWSVVQPSPGVYDWGGLDSAVAVSARAHLDVLPFLYATPRWLARQPTVLPISNRRQRAAWAAFLEGAVERYGPRGSFWQEHARGSADFVPRRPIKRWQIWNEPNFFYFTIPASPGRYARLLKLSHRAIRRSDRRAEIVLGGLFGDPKERPPRAMDATVFLQRLYRVRGVKRLFDGVALHPYAADQRRLRGLVSGLRRVIVRNGDRRAGLYLTELGWGSRRSRVSFEVGRRAQARELRGAYGYLIRRRRMLNLEQVHWFSWKDVLGDCSFCDSVGLFHRGAGFRPKPAWHALVRIAR